MQFKNGTTSIVDCYIFVLSASSAYYGIFILDSYMYIYRLEIDCDYDSVKLFQANGVNPRHRTGTLYRPLSGNSSMITC